jgi:hypothetical protein
VAHRRQERALRRVGGVGGRARLLGGRVQPGVVERDGGELGEALETLNLRGLERATVGLVASNPEGADGVRAG